MQTLVSVLFSPMVWALGFLWPLFAQVLLKAGLTSETLTADLIAGGIALCLGAVAQFRGSWIWVK